MHRIRKSSPVFALALLVGLLLPQPAQAQACVPPSYCYKSLGTCAHECIIYCMCV